MKFAKHRFFRTFANLHTALRKLPAAAADAAREQQPGIVIRKNDANICPKAV